MIYFPTCRGISILDDALIILCFMYVIYQLGRSNEKYFQRFENGQKAKRCFPSQEKYFSTQTDQPGKLFLSFPELPPPPPMFCTNTAFVNKKIKIIQTS